MESPKRDDQGLVLQHEATAEKNVFFLATLGSILLCGCESCSVTAVTERYTHTNDEKGPQCTLGISHDKRPAVQ